MRYAKFSCQNTAEYLALIDETFTQYELLYARYKMDKNWIPTKFSDFELNGKSIKNLQEIAPYIVGKIKWIDEEGFYLEVFVQSI